MNSPGAAYQIARHAESLLRWFSPEEAKARATEGVLSGESWQWPDPPGTQYNLF